MTGNRHARSIRTGASLVTLAAAGMFTADAASAQAAPAPNVVSACSGVRLPRSAVTDILTPVVGGIVAPVQDTVNPILGVVGALLPLTPPLSIDAAGLLANAAAGDPISLQVVNTAGVILGPDDRCDLQSDGLTLTTPQGVAIGGNRITGLGADGQDAVAGEIDSVALGNAALTDATAAGSLALGARAAVGPGATGSVALGTGATATAANSVALGAGSVAARGPAAGSAGEVSVGAPGAERQITNVAAGAAPTDAATVGQVAAQVGALADRSVQYDAADRAAVTLGGAGGTRVTNVAAGALDPASTDAVNGAQLAATNAQVASNATAITNLGAQVANGAIGPVRYADPATPTTPNAGVATNDLTLVGAATAPVRLHNVAAGAIAAGSTDAVNGGQVFALAANAANAVTYDADAAGARTNTVTLAGGNAAAPVTVANVAAGAVEAGSTQAVNGGQLFAANQATAAAQTTATAALALGSNSVQYGPGRTTVTFNGGGAATTLGNVAAGTAATDAVNVGQLSAGVGSAVTQANSYTDSRLAALDFDAGRIRRDSSAGTSSALAAAGLPQAYEAGKGMIALGGGTYRGQSAVALGLSKAFDDGRTVMKLAGSYDSRGRVGAAGGVGYQF